MPCEERVAHCWILAPTVYDLDGQNARVTLVASGRELYALGERTRHREGRMLEAHEHLVAEYGDKPGSLEQNMLWLWVAGFSEVAALDVVVGCVLSAAVRR
jgi:hypothetical protein